ncbi:Fc.00g037940.m01.CDS01 [Cosmosporella sp. VM-42]
MPRPTTQTAVIQGKTLCQSPSALSLTVSNSIPVPILNTPHDVLVRILAAAGNPTDFKMVTYFHMEGNVVGCDFCGIVEEAGSSALFHPGTRICGADFPYRNNISNPQNGAFSQWIVVDSRHMLRVPDEWSDIQAAALGGIGWSTTAMAFGDPEALNLAGRPSKPIPSENHIPVLVYGGATSTGIIAIQVLKASGYHPIAVCSPASAERIMQYGAIGTANYTSPDCVEQIKCLAGGVAIKYALDCITDQLSVATCFAVLARTGSRYACLEDCPEEYRTRRAVKVKVVMAFEMFGYDVNLEHASYTRPANPELHAIGMLWANEMQSLLTKGVITTQLVEEVEGQFEGLVKVVEMIQSGQVSGKKLTVRVAS